MTQLSIEECIEIVDNAWTAKARAAAAAARRGGKGAKKSEVKKAGNKALSKAQTEYQKEQSRLIAKGGKLAQQARENQRLLKQQNAYEAARKKPKKKFKSGSDAEARSLDRARAMKKSAARSKMSIGEWKSEQKIKAKVKSSGKSKGR